jgi:hypothetical protein
MIAWQEEHDAKGTWVVAFFLSPGSECLKSGSGEPIPRFRLFSEEERALNEGQLLGEALMALEGPAPEGLANPMKGIRLKLLSSRVEGGTVYLDLASGIDDTNRTGSCGGVGDAGSVHRFGTSSLPRRAQCVRARGRHALGSGWRGPRFS